MRALLAVLLSFLLTGSAASQGIQAPEAIAKVMTRISTIGAGEVVEIQTVDGRKLKGEIGDFDNTSFELRYVDQGQVIDGRIDYSNVKSVRFEKRPGTGTKILAGVGTVGLVLMAIGGILGAAR